MIRHDWLLALRETGHRALCRGCGTTAYAQGWSAGIDLAGDCFPVTPDHRWDFAIPARAYACCLDCGTIRSAIAFDGLNSYGPVDLSGECSAKVPA